MKSRALGLVAILLSSSVGADVIYDSTGADPATSPVLNLSFTAIADEIRLAPGARLLESILFEYAGDRLEGDERVIIRVHALDGTPNAGSFGYATPGSLLWSAEVPIANTGAAAGTASAFVQTGSILLPGVIAVSLEPTGGFDPEDDYWRPLLKDPLAPGSSYSDIWRWGDDGKGLQWGLFDAGGQPNLNLALRVTATGTAVPDGGRVGALFLLPVLSLFAWKRLRGAA